MRILLVQPPSCSRFVDRVYLHEPLALEYVGAGLKADGHEVSLVDARLEPDLERAFRRRHPDLVGLTGYTSQVPAILEIARDLKALDANVRVAVGGHHATIRPADFDDAHIDFAVVGEGVQTIRDATRRIESGGSLRDIEGLALPGPDMHRCAQRRYTDLDDLPMPDRSLTARYRGRYFSEWLSPLASIRTSVGCAGRCSFCALWSITDGRYFRRDPQRVVEELRTIPERNVFFCDDESMMDARRMDRLADLIRDAGIRKQYFLYARADTIVRHPQLFAKWKAIGLSQVFVGLESYSDKHLSDLKKGVTIEQQAEAARTLEQLGILLFASFVVPAWFTREDFRALRRYVRELRIQYAIYTVLTPLPGTELYAEQEAELLTDRPELFDLQHTVLPTALPLKEFYAELAKLYRDAIPLKYVVRTVARYGVRGAWRWMRAAGSNLRAIRRSYLDH